MCFGGSAPSAPEVKYVGPSEADIQRNQEALQTYQQQIQDQQASFQASLQDQINQANQETESLRSKYAEDLAAAQQQSAAGISSAEKASAAATAAAGASANAKQVGALSVSATQSAPLQEQETTEAIEKKKKPKKNLKISTAGTEAAAGSGLNIGV